MKFIKSPSLFLLISLSSILCSCSTQTITSSTFEQFGNANNGLRMYIFHTEWKNNIPYFLIQIENVGPDDTVLNLGMNLAGGKYNSPTNLKLKLIEPDKNIWDLEFTDKRYMGIAGRVDEYLVFLRKHSSYSIKLGLDEFWCPKNNQEFDTLKSEGFKKGTYRISAIFEGTGFRHKGSIGEMIDHYWIGKLESNACVFKVR